MWKFLGVLACVLLLSQQFVAVSAFALTGSNGGKCAACTILVGLIERIAIEETPNKNVTLAFEYVCGNFQGPLSFMAGICDTAAVLLVATPVQLALDFGESPDVTCTTGALKSFNMCKDFPTCRLYKQFPPPMTLRDHQHASAPIPLAKASVNHMVRQHLAWLPSMVKSVLGAAPKPLGSTPVVNHRPLFDDDKDAFSTVGPLRGSHWRGKDCNDKDPLVYPGRRLTADSPLVDHNCNGIMGSDPNGKSYEDIFCAGTNPLGTIILGDSATAHFHLPPQYFSPDNQSSMQTYTNLLGVAADEADVPQCSWATGYETDANCPPSDITMNSIYQRMFQHNKCNHRDYQNIGVNGARTSSMAPDNGNGVIEALQRNLTDNPAIVFYALIGNDVCSGHQDFDHMSTPDEFNKAVTAALQYLDKYLAPGSHVVFSPLADGELLFSIMGQEMHPVGASYSDVYDYLNCLQTSPCWGWMNSNATVRNITQIRANLLSTVYTDIMTNQKYQAFDMHMIQVDMAAQFKAWIDAGHPGKDLIEPADGFHPSQTFHQMSANYTWAQLVQWGIINEANPNNAAITAMFGDQGGY